jgi:AcrR family transcriptional regulator
MNEELDTQDRKFGTMLEQIKELFFEFGIKNLNMDDISRKLGISKKTLYRFVKSKEDLIAKLFEYEENKGILSSVEIGNLNVNAIEKLFKVSLTVYEEMKRFNPMIMFELRKYYEQLFNEFHDRKLVQISQAMKENLKQGIEEGLYRADLNIEAIVALFINYLIDIHNSDMCKTVNLSFDELFRVMFENHIRAISTSAGVAFFEARKKEILENLKNNNQ